MARWSALSGKPLQWVMVIVFLVIVVIIILQQYSPSFKGDWQNSLPDIYSSRHRAKIPSKQSGSPCGAKRECPEDQFSFYIHSGAANVVPPAVCLQNKLVLGAALNNAGVGINILIINGKTGEVLKTDHFNMYSGDVKPLIDFLKSIEKGSIVMMASHDEPSTKLNEEARKLIAELGSSAVSSLGYRDNWVFVGAKGTVKSHFEKVDQSEAADRHSVSFLRSESCCQSSENSSARVSTAIPVRGQFVTRVKQIRITDSDQIRSLSSLALVISGSSCPDLFWIRSERLILSRLDLRS